MQSQNPDYAKLQIRGSSFFTILANCICMNFQHFNWNPTFQIDPGNCLKQYNFETSQIVYRDSKRMLIFKFKNCNSKPCGGILGMIWNQIELLQSLAWSLRYPKTSDHGELLLFFAILDQYFPIVLIFHSSFKISPVACAFAVIYQLPLRPC